MEMVEKKREKDFTRHRKYVSGKMQKYFFVQNYLLVRLQLSYGQFVRNKDLENLLEKRI